MNKLKSKVLILAAIVVIGAGGFLVNDRLDSSKSSADDVPTTQLATAQSKPVITFSEDKETVSYNGQTGITALAILQEGTDVTTQKSDFGDFVAGINGLQADAGKEYWSFYVNGAYANEGAGTYKTTDGEKIEWKLEKL